MIRIEVSETTTAALNAQAAAQGLTVDACLASALLSAPAKGLLLAQLVAGVAVYDARLLAVMLSRGIGSIVGLNERDFRRYLP